jgi:membrane fusion protein, heavy metal efflux system
MRLTAMLVLAAALPMLFAACGGEKHGETAAEKKETEGATMIRLHAGAVRDIGLVTVPVEFRAVAGILTIPATLIPDQDRKAQVGSLVQGRVREVFVRIGDRVKEGQVLMHIEGLEVGEIKAKFIKAKAQLSMAESNYQRQKTLIEQNIGSQRSYLEAQSERDKAVAEFNAEDRRIHSVGLSDSDLDKFVEHALSGGDGHTGGILPVRSPIQGTVVERNVVIGQLVDGSTTAFTIINTASLWADGNVYESDIPKLSGTPAVSFTVPAYPGRSFPGRVIYVAPVVDERSRTITVRAELANPGGLLKPQMFGQMRVPVSASAPGLIVPAEAVQKDPSGDYVFVATSDTTFEQRPVVTGISFDSSVEITKGLAKGERVVAAGSFQLKSELLKETLGEGD